ncbi:MAG: hypothetical protein R3305_10525 [Gammaproteobacteria bacterium]|nr:hypothetical protein [Gammaproteobacteria bacterium]
MKLSGQAIPFSLLLGIGLVASSDAQQMHEQIREGTIAVICRAGSTASHIKENCDYPRRSEELSREVEVPRTIELSVGGGRVCSGLVDMTYQQRSTLALVKGTLTSADCAASSGSYTITARIRNTAGDVETIDFEERWQRSDDEPVTFEAAYPIGDDVELLRMDARHVVCSCDIAAADDINSEE